MNEQEVRELVTGTADAERGTTAIVGEVFDAGSGGIRSAARRHRGGVPRGGNTVGEAARIASSSAVLADDGYQGSYDNVIGFRAHQGCSALARRDKGSGRQAGRPIRIPDDQQWTVSVRPCRNARERAHLALVVDEYAEPRDSSHLEELVEELIGEIREVRLRRGLATKLPQGEGEVTA